MFGSPEGFALQRRTTACCWKVLSRKLICGRFRSPFVNDVELGSDWPTKIRRFIGMMAAGDLIFLAVKA